MTQDHTELKARLKALDEKRTQGASLDWQCTDGNIWTDCVNGYGEQEQVLIGTSNQIDGEFMAAAPSMMTVIREQEAEIARKDKQIARLCRNAEYSAETIAELAENPDQSESAAIIAHQDNLLAMARERFHRIATVTSAGATKYATEWAAMRVEAEVGFDELSDEQTLAALSGGKEG